MRLVAGAMVTLLCSACSAPPALRVDPARVLADPEFLVQFAETSGFTLGLPTAIKWVPDGSAVLFLRSPPRSFVRDLHEFDPVSGKERRLLTAEQILAGAEERLSAEERARRERQRPPPAASPHSTCPRMARASW